METQMTFDIDGILSEEEAKKFFEEDETPQQEEEKPEEGAQQEKVTPTEEPEEKQEPESVGGGDENENEKDTAADKGGGSSPTVLSSIATALKTDGIFPDFADEELAAVKTPEDFAELVEKAINAKFDERQKRIDEALKNGVQPDTIQAHEQTISYLDSIDDQSLNAEDENGESLRKQLIFNDLMNKGYTKERAMREVEKSFKSGSDIDDAKDSLEALKDFYKKSYQKIQDDAKKAADEAKAEQKKQADAFKKMVLEDEIKLGDTSLDKKTREKIYDAVSKPVYKDPDTGRILTAVQKFQKENPLEFLKQLGMWFVLTNGGKNTNGFTKEQVRIEKNKGIRELERQLNGSTLNMGGSLRYDGAGSKDGSDILLSDDWQIA